MGNQTFERNERHHAQSQRNARQRWQPVKHQVPGAGRQPKSEKRKCPSNRHCCRPSARRAAPKAPPSPRSRAGNREGGRRMRVVIFDGGSISWEEVEGQTSKVERQPGRLRNDLQSRQRHSPERHTPPGVPAVRDATLLLPDDHVPEQKSGRLDKPCSTDGQW